MGELIIELKESTHIKEESIKDEESEESLSTSSSESDLNEDLFEIT